MNYLFVLIGGGIGSVVRYWLSINISTSITSTFISNFASSFILGCLAAYLQQKSNANENLRLLLAVGFCGGFSTFSTFSLDVFKLLQTGDVKLAVINVLGSVFSCVLAVVIGFYLVRYIHQ